MESLIILLLCTRNFLHTYECLTFHEIIFYHLKINDMLPFQGQYEYIIDGLIYMKY